MIEGRRHALGQGLGRLVVRDAAYNRVEFVTYLVVKQPVPHKRCAATTVAPFLTIPLILRPIMNPDLYLFIY